MAITGFVTSLRGGVKVCSPWAHSLMVASKTGIKTKQDSRIDDATLTSILLLFSMFLHLLLSCLNFLPA